MSHLQLRMLAALVLVGWLLGGCAEMEDAFTRPSAADAAISGWEEGADAGISLADPDATAVYESDGVSIGEESKTPPDAGAAAHTASDATVQPGAFSILSTQIQPNEIAQGGTVAITVQVKSDGHQALEGGELWIVGSSPDGRFFTEKTPDIGIAVGATITVKQLRGPYSVVGDWVFTPTLRDQAGAVLADGTAQAATVKVTQSSTPLTPIAGTLKVLVYNGYDAGPNGVKNSKACMDLANSKNLVAGVKFSYATSTVINASTLAGYNVLIMPGGDSGRSYLNNANISGAAIKSFVSKGGGYVGTCAGAYSAAAHTDGYYDGWGIAPNIYAKAVSYEGNLPITFAAEGTRILAQSGTKTLHHWNGAAMYKKPEIGTALILATYANNSTKYQGLAAIVADVYGSGRTVLSGPHPELDPQFPVIVVRMIAWAGKAL